MGVGGKMAQAFSKKFYDSKLWKDARRYALHRDGYSCQLCGARATEIHHIIPLAESNINDWNISLNPDNLQSLCYDCHGKVTKGITDVSNEYVFDDTGQVIKRT